MRENVLSRLRVDPRVICLMRCARSTMPYEKEQILVVFNPSFLCFRPFWVGVGYKDQPRDQH